VRHIPAIRGAARVAAHKRQAGNSADFQDFCFHDIPFVLMNADQKKTAKNLAAGELRKSCYIMTPPVFARRRNRGARAVVGLAAPRP
jgi:hypothetical protein